MSGSSTRWKSTSKLDIHAVRVSVVSAHQPRVTQTGRFSPLWVSLPFQQVMLPFCILVLTFFFFFIYSYSHFITTSAAKSQQLWTPTVCSGQAVLLLWAWSKWSGLSSTTTTNNKINVPLETLNLLCFCFQFWDGKGWSTWDIVKHFNRLFLSYSATYRCNASAESTVF